MEEERHQCKWEGTGEGSEEGEYGQGTLYKSMKISQRNLLFRTINL
jgi:hypothetical protein